MPQAIQRVAQCASIFLLLKHPFLLIRCRRRSEVVERHKHGRVSRILLPRVPQGFHRRGGEFKVHSEPSDDVVALLQLERPADARGHRLRLQLLRFERSLPSAQKWPLRPSHRHRLEHCLSADLLVRNARLEDDFERRQKQVHGRVGEWLREVRSGRRHLLAEEICCQTCLRHNPKLEDQCRRLEGRRRHLSRTRRTSEAAQRNL